ncbi:MAG: CYTH domain-containing protein [Clostridiales bacterium]|nr:CYTH domain-containing protein [Clostridiales bacterium]
MSVEIDMKLLVSDKYTLEKIKNSEILTRYYKDDFVIRQTFSEYLDTPDWDLDQNNYILRIRKWENYHVAALKHGTIDHLEHPGLFRGRQWTCYYSTPETVISDLQARAAPEELSEIVKDKKLEVCFSSEYKRLYTTLYMPDRVRIELTLDEGSIHCDGKSESLYHIGFELLFGNTEALVNLSSQIMEAFGLMPDLLTKQQRALRLIRSRI